MSTELLHLPTYRRDLGDGLVLRWSTAADLSKIQDLYSFVFRDGPEAPHNQYVREWVSDFISGRHPESSANDCALVEDTRNGKVVASLIDLHQSFEYEGVTLPVGRPEAVASMPDYRNRGLIRAIFELFHARSAVRGDLLQAITGILHYYRQFGYEYALDLGGGRTVQLDALPKLADGEAEAFALRDATLEDLPLLQQLYDRDRSRVQISTPIPANYWQWLVNGQRDIASEGWVPLLITRQDGQACGYSLMRRTRYGDTLGIHGLGVAADVSWAAAVPSLLRALGERGAQQLVWDDGKELQPLRKLSLGLGSSHPSYQFLAESSIVRVEKPYAYYIRVPDILSLLRRITPVLERRLARSVMANYSGELRLSFFRSGLHFVFEQGAIRSIEPWQPQPWGPEADAGFPPLVFLQILFGRRSLAELNDIFPDAWAKEQTKPLIEALFPRRNAWALPLD